MLTDHYHLVTDQLQPPAIISTTSATFQALGFSATFTLIEPVLAFIFRSSTILRASLFLHFLYQGGRRFW